MFAIIMIAVMSHAHLQSPLQLKYEYSRGLPIKEALNSLLQDFIRGRNTGCGCLLGSSAIWTTPANDRKLSTTRYKVRDMKELSTWMVDYII